jgi:hypothetical protein
MVNDGSWYALQHQFAPAPRRSPSEPLRKNTIGINDSLVLVHKVENLAEGVKKQELMQY